MTNKNLRFSKDFNLPINIFDDEMFNYYRNLYKDFWPYEEEKLMDEAIEKLGGVEKWLEYCGNVRDNAILSVTNSDSYKIFNDSKNLLKEYDVKNINIGEHSLYTDVCENNLYISVDIKKANFQALKFAGVINDNTYKDFIVSHGGDEYFAKSKYLRQVIFGKMNPGRIIKVEKFIISKIREIVELCFPEFELMSLNSDELIYKLKDTFGPGREELDNLSNIVKSTINIDVRVECLKIHRLPIVNVNGNKVDAFVRTNINTNEQILKKASTTFYPQIYKLWKGMEINEKDMTVYIENQLAVFKEPLRLA